MKRAGRAGGALNAGRAWIHDGGAVDGLGQGCYGILDLCFDGGLSFLSVSIASKFRPRTESAHQFFVI